MQNESTETLINLYHSAHEDAIALVFINPRESARLGDLALKIRIALAHRGINV